MDMEADTAAVIMVAQDGRLDARQGEYPVDVEVEGRGGVDFNVPLLLVFSSSNALRNDRGV